MQHREGNHVTWPCHQNGSVKLCWRAPSYLLVSEKKLKRGLTVAKFAFQKPRSRLWGSGDTRQSYSHSRLMRVGVNEQLGKMREITQRRDDQNKSLTFGCLVTNQHFMAVKPKKTRTTKNGDVTGAILSVTLGRCYLSSLSWATDDFISFPDLSELCSPLRTLASLSLSLSPFPHPPHLTHWLFSGLGKLGADKSLGWRMSWKGAERGFPSLECSQYRGPGSVIHPRFEWTWTFCSGSWENKSVTPRDHSRFQLFLTDRQQNEKNKNILLFISLHFFFLLKNPTSSRDYFFSFGGVNKSF